MQVEDSPYKVTLGVFEGPLDLLLHLIRSNEIDIYDIPIAEVTEQYLSYLSLMESLDLEVAGEWLVMAATLLEIKSRMLLPDDPKEELEEEAVDPRVELVERLIEYEKFKGAAEVFREREAEQAKVFGRGAVELDYDLRPEFDLSNITAVDLLAALQRILSDIDEEPVTSIQRRKVSVRMRMREIYKRAIDAAGQLHFVDLFDDVTSRVEVVITFLALLELLRQKKLTVKQAKAFAPIEIKLVEQNGS
ncbi:MAG: segregation/condensation protein A [Armatimonadetes bacterium]|jgi:segregation and condensation protein A|nr:segregation/condensation protein A [Armatimonadota bacterium]